MKCPECKTKIANDVRLLAFHMEQAHAVPRSVVLTILEKMGYDTEQFRKFNPEDYHVNGTIPQKIHASDSGCKRFTELLKRCLER